MDKEKFFEKSVVRDETGELLPVYHGSGTTITAFDPSYTGQGTDQYGSGFYFSTSRDTALGYTTRRDSNDRVKLGGEDNPNVLECYLNIQHPLVVDGVKYANLRHVDVGSSAAYKLLRRHPGLYISPESEDGGYNPMWDFFDLNGVTFKKRSDAIPYIRRLANEYFNDTNMLLLDVFFGSEYATEFRCALREVLGYDGLCINFKNQQHWIAWFPEQVKLVTNDDPELSPELAH